MSSEADVSRCAACARSNPAGSPCCSACGRRVRPDGDPPAGPGARPDESLDLAAEVRRLAEVVDRHDTILSCRRSALGIAGVGRRAVRHPLTQVRVRTWLQQRSLAVVLVASLCLMALALTGPGGWERAIGGLRQELNRMPVLLGLVAGAGVLVMFVFVRRGRNAGTCAWTDGGWAIFALALAAAGQGLLLGGHTIPGTGFYLVSMAAATWEAHRSARRAPMTSGFVLRYEALLPLVLP